MATERNNIEGLDGGVDGGSSENWCNTLNRQYDLQYQDTHLYTVHESILEVISSDKPVVQVTYHM